MESYISDIRRIVSAYVMGVIDRSFENMEAIFAHASRTSSLVHSDYNLWNVMVDPQTYEPTGVIDPIDAGWADREIDLFHLANCRPSAVPRWACWSATCARRQSMRALGCGTRFTGFGMT